MSTVEYYNGTPVLNPVPPLTLALQGLLLKRYFNERKLDPYSAIGLPVSPTGKGKCRV